MSRIHTRETTRIRRRRLSARRSLGREETLRVALAVVLAILLAGCGGSFKRFLYDGFGRDDWQQPRRVIAALQIEPGERIADIGAGGGYFTVELAEATGETGMVYAVDVDPDMVEFVGELAAREGLSQVRTVLAEPDDPGLPEGEIDLIFLSNTYHHIENRPAYFAGARRALAPGGRLAIVEFREEGLLASLFGHATDDTEIEEEMQAAGYRLERAPDFLERQHFLLFAPIEPRRTREEAMRRADQAARALTTELMSRLQAALAEGGPANGVRVCSEVAQDVTEQLGGERGLSVRRTSLRTRNPDNDPDELERAWLVRAAAANRAGETVQPLYQVLELPGGGTELHHLRPIIFPGGICSGCHGSEQEIPPAVQEILRERYPRDQATGFQPGDLRGAISVRVPMSR